MTLRVHPDEIVRWSTSPLLAKHASWERVRLRDVADVLNGFAFKSAHFNIEKGIPLLRIRDVGASRTQVRYDGEHDPRYIVSPGSIVVGMDGDFRAARWNGPPALLNQRVCTIKVRDPRLYDESFLLYALPGYLGAIHDSTSSITVKHLSSETIKDIPLPVPPLAEQRRIVTAIEEQLSRLDGAESFLAGAEGRAARMKVLILNSLIPAARDGTALKELADVRLGRQRSPKNHFGPTMRPYIRAANLTWRGLKLDDVKEMNFPRTEAATYELLPGDVLLSEASGSAGEVGKPAVWDGEIAGCCFQNTVIRVRSRGPRPEFLRLVFLRAALLGQFAQAAPGVGIHHLGASRLAEWPIPACSIDEQERIIESVDRQFSLVEAMQERVGDAARRGKSLRRSLLASAFRGELVTQDQDEEAASVLLERIAAERAVAAKPARKREAKMPA